MTSSRLVDLWPAAGVRVRAGDLEMRWINDELAVDLALLAGKGVHDRSSMPFGHPWTRGTEREVARNMLTYQWAARSRVGTEGLTLELGVLVGGEAVGIQSASGDNWSVLREVETGSWLGRAHQGMGIGRRMRALMLHFCFDALGAESVVSTAFTDNAASNAVSLRTGYAVDGIQRVVREGSAATQTRYRMDRDRWATVCAANREILGADVEVTGVDALLADLRAGGLDS
jgi:RimJ/RimL family protein N-acetyltransferase